MSHRRPEPRQAALERALRQALWLAADSVEPGSDGLARIRTKIAAQPAPHVSWWTTLLARLLGPVTVVWHFLESSTVRLRYAAQDVPDWLRYAAGEIANWLRYAPGRFARWLRYMAHDFAYRFQPDRTRGGWVKWLRPAAGVATVLLVVMWSSWVGIELPAAFSPAGNSQTVNGGGGNSGGGPSGGGNPNANGSSSMNSPTSHQPGSSSATCRSSTPLRTISQRTSPAGSPSVPPSTSPSPSSSPSTSPSPSPSASTSPSPSPSPTVGVNTSGAPSTQAAGAGGNSSLPQQAAASGAVEGTGTQSRLRDRAKSCA